MLRWRIPLGAVLIAAFVGLCWLDWRASRPGIVLLPLAIVAALLAAGELLAMYRERAQDSLVAVVLCGTFLTVFLAGLPVWWQPYPEFFITGQFSLFAMGLAASYLLVGVGEMWRYNQSGRATINLALSTFAIFYSGGLMAFLVQLRLLAGPPWGDDGKWGMIAFISLVATVKMSDIGQYAVGRLLGRHKLAPTISPGKTWEGVVGGIVFACIGAWLVLHWCAPRWVGGETSEPAGTLAGTVVYAVALSAAGVVGDLFESLLKRDAGMKDSSSWMPGFGGVLDLMDSLLGAAPVAYLFWALGWVGP